MKIDNVGAAPIVGRPSPSNSNHAGSSSHAQNLPEGEFRDALRRAGSRSETAGMQSLAPLTEDEKDYLARLFARPGASSVGYDPQRNFVTANFSGSKLDIEA
jgi:hypothetical protein